MLQEQREKHEAESASRLQKQAKGIQTQLVLHYYDIYEKYHGIIMFLSIVPWQHIGLDMFFENAPYFLHSCYLMSSITARRNYSSTKL